MTYHRSHTAIPAGADALVEGGVRADGHRSIEMQRACEYKPNFFVLIPLSPEADSP